MSFGLPMVGIAAAAVQAAQHALKNLPTNGGQFVVDHGNVLAAAKIIQAQVDALEDRVDGVIDDLKVVGPGRDIVSRRVAEAWNERLVLDDDSYRQRVSDYVAGLRKLVVQLTDSAKAYGYNEDEISAVLGSGRRG